MVLISSIGVGLILYLVVRVQGRVSGVEFSPSHFQQREFEFWEIPWIHLQVSPIKRTSSTPVAARYIRQKSLITVPSGPPTQWHLVSIARGLSFPRPADGQLLTQHLSLGSAPGFWGQWSQDHPQAAATLWPKVQQIALRELYVMLPQTLELAQQLGDSPDFAQRMDEHIRNEYATMIEQARAAGQTDLAAELLAEARSDYPNDPTFQSLESGSHSQP